MKPFDLEAAKRGEPLITRNGQKIIFLAHDPNNPNEGRKVILRVVGNPMAFFVSEDGRISDDERCDSALDAFMAPKKRTVWVNLYYVDGGRTRIKTGQEITYDSQEAADRVADTTSRIGGKAWPIEIEE